MKPKSVNSIMKIGNSTKSGS